jgi:hypothetical protein
MRYSEKRKKKKKFEGSSIADACAFIKMLALFSLLSFPLPQHVHEAAFRNPIEIMNPGWSFQECRAR